MSSYFGWPRTVFSTTFFIAFSLLWESQMSSFWSVLVFIALYAPAYGGAPPLTSAMIAEYFGRQYLGTTSGLLSAVTTAGQAIGPFLMGYMYDTTGSYQLPLLIYGVLNLIGAVMLFCTKRPVLAPAAAVEGGR